MKTTITLFLVLIASIGMAQVKVTQATRYTNTVSFDKSPTIPAATGLTKAINLQTAKDTFLLKSDTINIDQITTTFMLKSDTMNVSYVTTIPTIYSAAGDTSNYQVPGKIGNIFINTSTGKVYVSSTAVRGGWKILN